MGTFQQDAVLQGRIRFPWRGWVGMVGLGIVSLGAIACAPTASTQPPASPSGQAADVPSGSQARIATTVPAPKADILHKLQGEWRDSTLLGNKQVPSLWFADHGKAYIISDMGGKKLATQVAYRLNTTTQPMQIDISPPGDDAPMLGIFEFVGDGNLRIDGGNVRPQAFGDRATVHKKVSAQATLPAEIQIMAVPPANTDRAQADSTSTEGKQMLAAMNSNQQALFSDKHQFAGTIADLGFGIPLESDNYSYKIVAKLDNQVVMSAQAKKPQLKSYTSVLIAKGTAKDTQVSAVICETAQPTAPQIQGKIADPKTFQCPSGSIAMR